MARLFITPREINFISDITKELMKDVVGQKIYYFPISEIKTKTHEIYNEALKKVFDNPIELDALVDNNFQSDTKIDQFGVDAQYKVEVYIQHRDLVEKNINVAIGDFFSFGQIFYEITERVFMRNIYGMPEHKDGVKLVGPTDISFTDKDAVQDSFVQQRGVEKNDSEEPTGDVRDLVKNGVLDPPLTGPKQVSSAGDSTGVGSAFYDED